MSNNSTNHNKLTNRTNTSHLKYLDMKNTTRYDVGNPCTRFKILMDSVEDYARQWVKREKEDLNTLSEWLKSVNSLIQNRIKKLSYKISPFK